VVHGTCIFSFVAIYFSETARHERRTAYTNKERGVATQLSSPTPAPSYDAALSDEQPGSLDTCARCAAQVQLDELSRMHDNALWCGACYEDATTCYHCARTFSSEDVSYDRDDDPHCESCQDAGHGRFGDDDDDDDDDDHDAEYDNRTVYDHDNTVFGVLGLGVPDDHVLHFGFEIELNTRNDNKYEAARAFISRADRRGIVKHDGSIGYGRTGIELISAPLSLDAIRFLIGQAFHNNALHDDAFTDATCGMHVHASRSALTASQIAKLVRFIHEPNNCKFMESLAGRPLADCQWASLSHRTSWKQAFVAAASGPWRMSDFFRYSALNLTNHDTIEFRIFASTTQVMRARANVEACAALLAFCATASHSLTASSRYETFCSFVGRRRRDYPHLVWLLSTIVAPAVAQVSPSLVSSV